jgi:DNA-binding PadR family transcriptional regulator
MGPIKPAWYFILLSLSAGARHGSAIRDDVIEVSEGRVRLWPVALYGSLEELRARGWIEPVSEPSERPPDESERKRFYRLTAAGRRALAGETERLAAVVRTARTRLKLRSNITR